MYLLQNSPDDRGMISVCAFNEKLLRGIVKDSVLFYI